MRKPCKKGPADPRVHGRQLGSIFDSVGRKPTKRVVDVIKRVRLKNGRELIIRKAEPNDALDILAYIHQVSGESDYLTFGPGEFGLSQEEEAELIETVAASDNRLMICAFLDGRIVGQLTLIGGLRPRVRHAAALGVSVLKEYWRLGIASALIESSLDWARASKVIRKVNLRVRSDHGGAIRLYQGLGFAQEGIVTREFFLNGNFYDSIQMGLKIDE